MNNKWPIRAYALRDQHMQCILQSLRESAMNFCDGMEDACWENVHEGMEWEPVAEGFIKSIVLRLNTHDILVDQKANYERGAEKARTLAEKDGSQTVNEYMKNIIEELKSATRERGRRDDIHIVK